MCVAFFLQVQELIKNGQHAGVPRQYLPRMYWSGFRVLTLSSTYPCINSTSFSERPSLPPPPTAAPALLAARVVRDWRLACWRSHFSSWLAWFLLLLQTGTRASVHILTSSVVGLILCAVVNVAACELVNVVYVCVNVVCMCECRCVLL